MIYIHRIMTRLETNLRAREGIRCRNEADTQHRPVL